MEIIDKYDRKVLAEGRDYGMGFAFAKKEGNKYTAVQAITCCKDYLNDVLYAEKTGNILPEIYGFTYDKINNLNGNKYYLIIKILPKNKGGYGYSQEVMDKDIATLKSNYKNIQRVVNLFEAKLGIPKTKITRGKDGYFVVSFNKFWTKTLYLFGLYTLIIRVYQNFLSDSTD